MGGRISDSLISKFLVSQKGVTPKGRYTFILHLETVHTVYMLAHVKDKPKSAQGNIYWTVTTGYVS